MGADRRMIERRSGSDRRQMQGTDHGRRSGERRGMQRRLGERRAQPVG